MIFSTVSDPLVQNAIDCGLKELNEFWGTGWNRNTPNAFIFNSREEIDAYWGYKTEKWLKGWTHESDICLLAFDKFETEAERIFSKEEYEMLIKHEMCHLFYGITSEKKRVPKWLIEGLAVFLSGQLESKKRPESFSSFLDYYSKEGKGVYGESGFVVELLINKFGRDKVVQFVRQMKDVKDEEGVGVRFRGIFGIDLTYEALNDLYTK
jgi:hypothetical protein